MLTLFSETAAATVILQRGILLPEAVLHSEWFAILAAFVAVNTVIYVCLSLFKIFPVPRLRWRGRSRRRETRSIYPDGPV